MQQQIYNDPTTGRPYYIDPTTNQPVWADTPAIHSPVSPVVNIPAPNPGAPAFDPAQLGNAAYAMNVNPVQPQGNSGAVNIQLSAYDFSKVEDKLIMVLDTSIAYEFVVSDIKGKKSSTGEDMIEVHLSVSWPLNLPNGEACKGASMIDNISMAPNALWKAKSFLSACEMLGPDGRFKGNSISDVKGCVVRANVRNEVWNDQTRSKISGGYKAGFETPGMSPVAPAVGGPAAFVPPAAPAPGIPAIPQAPTAPAPAPTTPQPPVAPAPPPTGLAPQPGPAPTPSFPQAPQLPQGAPMPAPQMPAPPQ